MQRSRDNTAKLAKELWSLETNDLLPEEFQSRFDELYARSEGPATLWRLGGAANDYLLLHPDSIQVPSELVAALLDSPLVDGRVIGLKLLARYSSDIAAIADNICQALAKSHQGEVYGGLYELSFFLERRQADATELPKEKIVASLRKLDSSSDPYIRESAARLSEELNSQ